MSSITFSVEVIAKDVEKQQKEMVVLDTKVDATIGTVVAIGDKVIEHDEEIGELGEGLERVEERVDDVEEDLGETKVKVEEIDNKVRSKSHLDSHLRNEFDILNVHGIMNTSGPLQNVWYVHGIMNTSGLLQSMFMES